MKNSVKTFLLISCAFVCIMFGVFIGRNALPNYFFRSYTEQASDDIPAETAAEIGKININTASIEDLVQLPGIGQATAEDIVQYRTEHGNFAAIEDLLNVKGIGYGTLYNIHEMITTGG